MKQFARPLGVQKLARRMHRRVSNLSPARITVVGALVNVLLSVFKVGVGSMANSAVLVADGWHSLSDLASDVLCWGSVRLGARPADASHPNGYRRYEHLGTLGIAGMLLTTGGAMTLQSGRELFSSAWSSA